MIYFVFIKSEYFLVLSTKSSETKTNLVAMSTLKLMISKYHFQSKEPVNLKRTSDSGTAAGNVQDEPGTS